MRHDLSNIVTALENGCMLVEARLKPRGDAEVRDYLAEMRARLDTAEFLLDRLREIGTDPSSPLPRERADRA